MDDRQKTKLLYKFLKKNCILRSYIENTIEYNKRIRNETEFPTKIDGKPDVLSFLTNYSEIGCAFIWANTKQGDSFWRRKQSYWQVYYLTNS